MGLKYVTLLLGVFVLFQAAQRVQRGQSALP